MHDVKTLKLKLRPDEERKYNSPWNIAADFKVDMSFNPAEISTMLKDYANETGVKIDIPTMSKKLHEYTAGYPFLVSKLCKTIDEDILPKKQEKAWDTGDLEQAGALLLNERNTNFDSLFNNLEHHPELYELTQEIILGQKEVGYAPDNLSLIHI